MRVGSFKVGVVIPDDVRKLFSKRDWNDAFRAAMIRAGHAFVRDRLPPRFGPFAKELGYSAKKLGKKLTAAKKLAIAYAEMRRDGSRDKIVAARCARWGGWDPTGPGGPPAHVFRAWVKDAFSRGKIPSARASDWRFIRQEMRREVIEQSGLRAALRDYAMDNYVQKGLADEPIPLVQSGEMLRNHQRWARVRATAKAGGGALNVTVPRGRRTHPQVNRVLGNATEIESADVGAQVFRDLDEWIASARMPTAKNRLKTARFSAAARKQINRANRSGAKKSRTVKGAPPRKV